MKHCVFTDEFKMNSYIWNKRKFQICNDRILKTYYVPCPYHNRDNQRHVFTRHRRCLSFRGASLDLRWEKCSSNVIIVPVIFIRCYFHIWNYSGNLDLSFSFTWRNEELSSSSMKRFWKRNAEIETRIHRWFGNGATVRKIFLPSAPNLG
jgi:hypothetical protein